MKELKHLEHLKGDAPGKHIKRKMMYLKGTVQNLFPVIMIVSALLDIDGPFKF